MLGVGLLVLQQLSEVNGVLFYTTSIFESAGISSSSIATFAVGAIQVVATAVAGRWTKQGVATNYIFFWDDY